MKRKLFTGIAKVLLFAGLTMLIAPRISNHVGEQIAHTTIEDFKALKSKATSDEPTEKKESSEDSISNSNPAVDSSKSDHDPDWQIEDEKSYIESGELSDSITKVDFDRLYSDSVAYNENLKTHQNELLVDEQSYQKEIHMKHFYRTRDRPPKPFNRPFQRKERKLEKHYQKSGRRSAHFDSRPSDSLLCNNGCSQGG